MGWNDKNVDRAKTILVFPVIAIYLRLYLPFIILAIVEMKLFINI